MTSLALAAAVNDDAVLDQCLAASPDVRSGHLSLKTYRGYASSGAAYNQALSEADARWVALVHQDVYLPAGTAARLQAALEALDASQPDWAVAGVIGINAAGQVVGKTWSSGLARIVGDAGPLPARVEGFDELLIIVRTQAGLAFDEALPSFHLYGTDIVQIAKQAGRTAWVIDLPVIHFSRPVTNLGGGYRDAWKYMQAKWRSALPIPNLVCPIGRSILPLLKRDLRLRIKFRGKSARTQPPGNPQEIAARLGWGG